MIHVTICPRCQRAVVLPEDADAAASVRCPLCSAEYPLREALPPALVVVPKSDGVADAANPAPSTEQLGEPLSSQGETIALPTDAAIANAEFLLPAIEPSVLEPPISPPAIADSAAVESVAEPRDEKKAEDSFAFDFEEHLAESVSENEEALGAVEMGDAFSSIAGGSQPSTNGSADLAISPAVDPSATAALAERPLSTQPPPPRRRLVKPAPPRRRKKKGPIRLLIEWVAGLCVALIGFYYGMWWIRGESAGLPRFDWAPFLPAQEHIAQMPLRLGSPPEKAKPSPTAAMPGSGKQTSLLPETVTLKKEPAIGPQTKVEATPGVVAPPAIEGKKPTALTPDTPPPEPAIGPRPPANFSFLDFDTAIDEATYALFNKSEGKIDAESYPAFCKMAEVQTYIPPDKQSPAQQKSVKILLDNLAKDREQISTIGHLATAVLKNTAERPGGIVLAGKVTKISTNNQMFGAFVKPADSDEPVVVLSAKEMPFKIDDEVLLTGGIVAKPSENIRGFKGRAPLAVWLGAAVPVPAAAEKN